MIDKFCSSFLGMLQKIPGKWLIIMAAVFWSTGSAISKCFQMDTVLLAALRSLITGVVLLPFLRLRKVVWNKWLFLLIISNICLVICILTALRFTTAANALALQYTASMWIALWSLLVLKHKMPLKRMLPVIMTALGVAVIMLEPNTGSNALGNIFGMFSGIFFAAVTVLYKKVDAGGDLGSLCIVHFSTGVIILGALLILPGGSLMVPAGAWPYIIYMGIVQMAFGYICYLTGMNTVSPQKAATLSIWEFILTPVWAFVLVGELPTLCGAAGWLILLAAALLEGRLNQAAEPGPVMGKDQAT